MRKLLLSLISLIICMLMLCSCVYEPDTVKEVDVSGDSADKIQSVNLMANEIVPEGNTANIMRPMSGQSDEQAEAMRSKILNSEDNLNITGTKYYVSSKNGNDENDGLTPETAWATTDAISLNAWNMKKGDSVYFHKH